MEQNLYLELSTATGVTLNAGESGRAFLLRLLTATSTISEEKWNALTEEAKGWFNDSAGLVSTNQEPLPLAGFVSPEPTPATPVPVAAPKAIKTPKAPPAPAAPKADGIMLRMRKHALLNPTWTYQQVAAQMTAEGVQNVSINSAWACHTEVHNVLKAIASLKWEVTKPAV